MCGGPKGFLTKTENEISWLQNHINAKITLKNSMAYVFNVGHLQIEKSRKRMFPTYVRGFSNKKNLRFCCQITFLLWDCLLSVSEGITTTKTKISAVISVERAFGSLLLKLYIISSIFFECMKNLYTKYQYFYKK